MQKCPNCGYKNSFSAMNCQLCNHDLSGPPQTARPLGGDPNVIFGAGSTTRRFGGQTERYYIVPMVGDQVKLEPGFTYLMGRDVSCQIRIGSPKASRKHAEIKFEGNPPKPIVKDLGGQNGTRVNGRPLPKEGTHELQDRDDIELGDIHLAYRKLAPGESEKMLREEAGEATMATLSVPKKEEIEEAEAEAAFTGNASIIPLADILKRLEGLRATGVLVVEAGNQKGFVQLQGGRAIGGAFGGFSGPQAAAAVAALTSGKFRFDAADGGDQPPPPETTRPTQRMAPSPQAPLPAAQPAARPTGPVPRPGAAPPPGAPRPMAPPAPRPAAAPGQAAPPPRPMPGPAPGAPRPPVPNPMKQTQPMRPAPGVPGAPPPPRPNPPPPQRPPGT